MATSVWQQDRSFLTNVLPAHFKINFVLRFLASFSTNLADIAFLTEHKVNLYRQTAFSQLLTLFSLFCNVIRCHCHFSSFCCFSEFRYIGSFGVFSHDLSISSIVFFSASLGHWLPMTQQEVFLLPCQLSHLVNLEASCFCIILFLRNVFPALFFLLALWLFCSILFYVRGVSSYLRA